MSVRPTRKHVQLESVVPTCAPLQPKLSGEEVDRLARLFVLLATVTLPESSKPCGDEEANEAR